MSAYNPSPHGYQALPSPNGDIPLPVHHGLPPHHPQQAAYPFDPQSAAQLQSPPPVQYSNGHGNGPSNGHHGEGDAQAEQAVPPPAPASTSGGEGQKGNRLRKACDSCSVRKVKVVVIPRPFFQTGADIVPHNSAMNPESLVELVLLWTSHAPLIDRARDAAHPIDMRRRSRELVLSPLPVRETCPLPPPQTILPRLWYPSRLVQFSVQNQSVPSQSSRLSLTTSSPTSIRFAPSRTNPPSELPSLIDRTSAMLNS